jgi:flagellar motor switch protein FliM
MADILSQSEIDSLLQNIGNQQAVEEILTGKREVDKEITGYDFRRPNRLSKNQLRTLQNIHESFSEALSYYLVSRLQTIVSAHVTSVDQLFYSEFILSVSNPGCLYIFGLGINEGSAILEFSPQLAFVIIERLLGGLGEVPKKVRAITQIEQSVLKGIVERALMDLQASWKTVGNLNFKFERFESEADFVQIAPPSEIVVVVTFEVMVTNRPYLMNLCFPTFALEEVISKLNFQHLSPLAHSGKGGIRHEVLSKQMLSTKVPVVGMLGNTHITIGELMNLEVGDVLRINRKVDQELEIFVNQRKKFFGKAGVTDGHKSVKIIRAATEDEMGDTL